MKIPHDIPFRIALAGNPNSGKTTLFNCLTGLKQKTANYPGTTVDKRTGAFYFSRNGATRNIEVIDLPGAYSLFPTTEEEKIAVNVVSRKDLSFNPDMIVYVADATNLNRSLYYCSQIIETKTPVILILNMIDVAVRNHILIDCGKLSALLGIKVVVTNANRGEGLEQLKDVIFDASCSNVLFSDLQSGQTNGQGIAGRYRAITEITRNVETRNVETRHASSLHFAHSFTEKTDKILMHWFLGYTVFLLLLFIIFQSLFTFAAYPMSLIENGFLWLSGMIKETFNKNIVTDFFANGLLPGISGIVMFVPQIAMLFAFIAILEDSGYMARVGFITDRLMRHFGLGGRSVIPMISGVACAVPAIMSARTIGGWKERLITIMVTPLITCSARLPVYVLIIALVIPDKKVAGILNLQGVALMGMYLIGVFAAVAVAWLLKQFLPEREKGYFIMELPEYHIPRWGSVGMLVFQKVKIFLFDVGKVIIIISLLLWALASFGPGDTIEKIDRKYAAKAGITNPDQRAVKNAEKLEASYAGIIGKAIEPAIEPLGFNWKTGIALLTSFAAREVFVGTMATIYSVSAGSDQQMQLKERMRAEINPVTGKPVYGFASGLSLLVFYAFAMQCMSTMAVVYRETGGLKWPLFQFAFMGILAYGVSLLVYQLLG